MQHAVKLLLTSQLCAYCGIKKDSLGKRNLLDKMSETNTVDKETSHSSWSVSETWEGFMLWLYRTVNIQRTIHV